MRNKTNINRQIRSLKREIKEYHWDPRLQFMAYEEIKKLYEEITPLNKKEFEEYERVLRAERKLSRKVIG